MKSIMVSSLIAGLAVVVLAGCGGADASSSDNKLLATTSTSAGPAGFTYCASENGSCSFAGTHEVAYGANGTYNYKTITGSTGCNNAVFGDPVPGTVKACFYQTSIAPGTVYRLINPNSSLALDVAGAGTNDGTNVQVWTNNDTVAQRWQTNLNGDGTWTLINPNSSKALDDAGAGTADGTNVQIATVNGSNAQKWRINTNSDGSYTLINVHANKALDVAAAGVTPGTNVHLWTSNGTVAQKWSLLPVNTGSTPPGWKLVWRDEFDGTAIDTSKWNFEVNGKGGGNNELQYYTARAQNARLDGNGNLVIEARKESYTGPDGTRQYTSARLNTAGKAGWTYGRIEARLKLPDGQGLWPAFWMLPTDNVYGTWAASGEIDIMEAVNLKRSGGNNIYGSIHYGGAWPNNTYTTVANTPSTSVADNFHVYAVEWEYGRIRWYVDNVLYSTQTNWWSAGEAFPAPFDQKFHVLLNVAVGGNWPGSPDGMTVFPKQMLVDYVRVYQK